MNDKTELTFNKMLLLNSTRLVFSILCLFFIVSCKRISQSNNQTQDSKDVNVVEVSKPQKSTGNIEPSILNYQTVINNNSDIIEEYYSLYQILKDNNLLINHENIKAVIDSLYVDEINSVDKKLKKLSENKNDSLKSSLELRKEELLVKKADLYSTHQKLDSLNTPFENAVSKIQKSMDTLVGVVRFTYNHENYTAFVADLHQHHLVTLHSNENLPIARLSSANKFLMDKGFDPLMITNAGMYHMDLSPVGLLVEDSIEKFEINRQKETSWENFFLMPNGVFYIDKGMPIVEETHSFIVKYDSKKINPTIATQSGPMLVIDGKHHHKFTHGSSSLKLRSGVGIMSGNKVVFIISEEHHTNFFQFATVFKDLFGCENALFLDGAISAMYLKGEKRSLGGQFGPMISVVKKQ